MYICFKIWTSRGKKILEEITKEAIEELKEYGDRAEFLRELALYIKDRNK